MNESQAGHEIFEPVPSQLVCDISQLLNKLQNGAIEIQPSVTRLGDLLDFGQLFKALCNK